MWKKSEVEEVCVDDFSIRKRHTYGTIMIDIKTHRVIDLLPSRETQEVTAWLKEYPNINVVSRDGSVSYAAAIRGANVAIQQVSDRFHLLKGLSDACKKEINKTIKANFRIPKSGSHYDGESESAEYWERKAEPDIITRKHEGNQKKKEARVELVRKLSDEGYSISAIVRETGISYATVKKYQNPEFISCSGSYNSKMGSKIKPYEATIKEMIHHGRTFKEIEEEIRQKGYNGAASTIRMYATRERKLLQSAGGNTKDTEVVERKWLINLLYRPIEQIKGINEEQLGCVIKEYPLIGQLYDLLGSFKEILFSKKAEDLEYWIKEGRALGREEVDSFIGGVERDMEAVKNAIRTDYNNGLAKGSVNKLKLTKRIMYGRCSFDTLRKKVLLREQYKICQPT